MRYIRAKERDDKHMPREERGRFTVYAVSPPPLRHIIAIPYYSGFQRALTPILIASPTAAPPAYMSMPLFMRADRYTRCYDVVAEGAGRVYSMRVGGFISSSISTDMIFPAAIFRFFVAATFDESADVCAIRRDYAFI